MIDRARKFRVGLLVLVCGATFVGLVAFIAGSTLRRAVVQYDILFDENVKGMVVGSKVNFQGVPIGAVQDIRFEAGRTRVAIVVDPGRSVIQDVTHARLDRLLVTGQVTIELEGYQEGAAGLPGGSLIPAASTDPIQELKTSLPTLLERVGDALDQATATLARVDAVLSDENVGHLNAILANLENASALLPGELESTAVEARATLASFRPLADDARAALGSLGVAADRIAGVATSTGGELDESLSAVRRTLASFDLLATRLVAAASEAESLLGNNRSAVRTALVGFADAVREVQALARQLRAAPNSVLFGADAPEIELPATPVRGGNR